MPPLPPRPDFPRAGALYDLLGTLGLHGCMPAPLPTSSKAQEDVLYGILKHSWLEAQQEFRGRRDPPQAMGAPLTSWQLWHADPTGWGLFIKGINDESKQLCFAKIFPEHSTYSAEPRVCQHLRYAHGLVVSGDQIHRLGRAWIARISSGTWRLSPRLAPEVGLQDNGEPIHCYFSRLASVSTDSTVPEILAIANSATLSDDAPAAIHTALTSLIKGEFKADNAPEAGTIVSVPLGQGTYDAFVLASCKFFRRDEPNQNQNLVLVCDLVPSSKKGTTAELREAGLLRIPYDDVHIDYPFGTYAKMIAVPLLRILQVRQIRKSESSWGWDARNLLPQIRAIFFAMMAQYGNQ